MEVVRNKDENSQQKNQSQETNRVIKGSEKGGKNFTLHTENRVRKKDLFLTSREKLLRAYGGCLGAECRRRTWDTAKSPGEL